MSAEGLHGISARLGNLLEMGFEVIIFLFSRQIGSFSSLFCCFQGDAAETAAQYAPSVEIAVRWLTDVRQCCFFLKKKLFF